MAAALADAMSPSAFLNAGSADVHALLDLHTTGMASPAADGAGLRDMAASAVKAGRGVAK
jgi:hypothetical protein